MKKLFALKSSLIALSLGLFITSCGSDDNTDILDTDPEDQNPIEDPTGVVKNAFIDITRTGDDVTGTFFDMATGVAGQKVKGRVKFTSDKDMGRLYITRTLPGGEPEPFEFPELDNKSIKALTKPDGSIDLDKDRKKDFDFEFELDVPANAEDGETIYNFWATSGKGDFRDPSKRLLVGVGTIDVKIGTNISATTSLKSYSGIKLFAPDSEGKFETFFSLYNGEAYKIEQGPEFRAFWDFGYYYGADTGSNVSVGDNASLVSAKEFETEFPFPVKGLKPDISEEDVANETLNEAFFAISSKTAADFDAASVSADLDDIVKPSTVSVTKLEKGNIVEFVDNYGNKGLIKVVELQKGFNNDDFITIDVKVQSNSAIMDKDGSQFN